MSFVPGSSGVPVEGHAAKVIINGTDVTYLLPSGVPDPTKANPLSVPTQVLNWSSAEPFADRTATIRFPTISPFVTLGTGNYSWLTDFALVDIVLVYPDNSTFTVFEGMYMSEETFHDQTSQALTISCAGAIYELDLRRIPPGYPVQGNVLDLPVVLHAILAWLWWGAGLHFSVGAAPGATGIEYPDTVINGHFQPYVTGWIAEQLSRCTTSDGQDQYTIGLDRSRVAQVRLKDQTTVHWSITLGTPGLTVDVSRDFSMAPNVIWGEGESPTGCSWRNNKYPNRTHEADQPWPGGADITIGEDSARVETYKQRLHDAGWEVTWGESEEPVTEYDANDAQQTQAFQITTGLPATGDVDQDTWDAAFFNGPDPTGIYALARVEPLVRDPATQVELYDIYGTFIGPNPDYDADVIQVHHYVNFGQVGKAQGVIAANAMLARDQEPGYLGRITLNADPEEGSRFEIRAGDNIKLRDFRGTNHTTGTLFHISEVTVDYQSGQVSLSVDTKARDLLTLSAIWERERNVTAISRDPRDLKNRPVSTLPSDRPNWDCESGSGVIPKTTLTAGAWTVFRVAIGGTGNIQGVLAQTAIPAAFSLVLFDRLITPQELDSVEDGNPTHENYFSAENWDENSGLINGWGEGTQMAGYYPGKQSLGDPKTGKLFEYVASYFEPKTPPWIWVAIWCDTSTTIYGQLYPGLQKS